MRFDYRLDDRPFLSYIRVGCFYVEWGDGLVLHLGRLCFAMRIRLKVLQKRGRIVSDADDGWEDEGPGAA